jgi:hypothetical protein
MAKRAHTYTLMQPGLMLRVAKVWNQDYLQDPVEMRKIPLIAEFWGSRRRRQDWVV